MANTLASIYDFFLKSDYLSPGPEITHLGKPKFYNLFGVLTTLTAVFVSIYVKLDDIKRFIFKEDPEVTIYNKYDATGSLTLNIQDVMFIIGFGYYSPSSSKLEYLKADELPNQSTFPYLSLLGEAGFLNLKMNYSDGVRESTKVNMTQCSLEVFKNYNNHIDYGSEPLDSNDFNELSKYTLCLPSNLMPFNISNGGLTLGISFPIFNIPNKFVSELSKKYNDSIITLFVGYQEFEFNSEAKNYDNYNYFRRIWKQKQLSIYTESYIKTSFFTTNHNIERDRKRLFFPESDKNSTRALRAGNLVVYPYRESFRSNNVEILFNLNDREFFYKFKYVSIDNILGDYGGLIQVFFFFGAFLTDFVAQPFLYQSILNLSHNFHDNDPNLDLSYLGKNDRIKGEKEEERKLDLLLKNEPNKEKDLSQCAFDMSNSTVRKLQAIELTNLPNLIAKDRFNEKNEKRKKSNRFLKPQIASLKNKKGNLNKSSNSSDNLESIIASYLKTRKVKKVSCCSTVKILYYDNRCNKRKDLLIGKFAESFKQKCEITEIMKLFDDVKIVKNILLNESQRELYILPSINLKRQIKTEDLEETSKLPFSSDLEEKVKKLKGIKLKSAKESVLVDNIISSII